MTTRTAREEGATLALSPAPPFDLLKALVYLERRGLFVDPGDVGETGLRVPLDVGGRAVLVAIEQEGGPDAPALLCRTAEALDERERGALAARVGFFLGVDDDPAPFWRLARDDAPFWRLAGTLEGLHRTSFPTAFEAIGWFVLRQREYTSVALARRRALRESLGAATGDGNRHAFPTPRALLDAPFETVRDLVRKRRKAHYLRHAAEAFETVDEAFFLAAPVEEVEAWLLEVRGIGPWTARSFLANGLNRPRIEHTLGPDGKPTAGWREVFARVYGEEGRDVGWLAERAEHYGEWQGYWLVYARFVHRAMRDGAGG